MARPPELSIVVPVLDERENLAALHGELLRALRPLCLSFELIFADDKSRDGSRQVLLELLESDPEHVRLVFLRRTFGQTAAMAAGFEHSRGRIVVTMDADLQNDPADIKRLLERLAEGYDLVVGWRRDRHDGFFLRRIPSILANRLIRVVMGTSVHDTGCTLKAFRRELVERMPIYAEQHRFLPALALGSGARISEIVVNHRPRLAGRSKYGIGRVLRVMLDLVAVKMVASFARSPLVYFAMLGTPFVLALMLFLCMVVWSAEPVSFGNQWGRAVIMTLSLFAMTVANFILLGLLAELVVRTSTRAGGARPLTSGARR